MHRRVAVLSIASALTVPACGDPDDLSPDGMALDGAGAGADAAPGPDAGPTLPTAAELLALLTSCDAIGGPYARDSGGTANIDVCSLTRGTTTAIWWQADLDVDCDGQVSTECNLMTDPSFLPQTAATDSMGNYLDAATLPFVVFPGASTRWDYRDHELGMRSIVAVMYQDRVVYGPAGDVGPQAIIGEASYAMAAALGIDPDPRVGGSPGPVTYVAFPGVASRVTVIEDPTEATTLGIARAQALLAGN